MNNEILEFIQRRFPNDSNWTSGNCFHFAAILKSCFSGMIVYDPVEGHFLFHNHLDGKYYDHTGIREYEKEYEKNFIDWKTLPQIDILWYKRLLRDCVL